MLDLCIVRFQEGVCDLSHGFKFHILDIFTFILRETEQKDRTVRAKTSKQAKTCSFTLPWPRNTLLDDAPSQVGVDQTARCPFDGSYQAGIWNAVLTGEPCKRLGLKIRNPITSIVL